VWVTEKKNNRLIKVSSSALGHVKRVGIVLPVKQLRSSSGFAAMSVIIRPGDLANILECMLGL